MIDRIGVTGVWQEGVGGYLRGSAGEGEGGGEEASDAEQAPRARLIFYPFNFDSTDLITAPYHRGVAGGVLPSNQVIRLPKTVEIDVSVLRFDFYGVDLSPEGLSR